MTEINYNSARYHPPPEVSTAKLPPPSPLRCSVLLGKRARAEGILYHRYSLICVVAGTAVKPCRTNPERSMAPYWQILHEHKRSTASAPGSEERKPQSSRKETVTRLQEHRQHYCAESCLLSCAEVAWIRLVWGGFCFVWFFVCLSLGFFCSFSFFETLFFAILQWPTG